MKEEFLQILEYHAKRYPLMEPQDYGKLTFQSEFGPEHLVSDKQQTHFFMTEEWTSLPENSSPIAPEPVGSSLYRFPLSACSSEGETELLTDLFILTASEHKGDRDGLEEKLRQLESMNIPDIKKWTEEWRQKGCPPVHHSSAYREAYHPHYRLLKKEYTDYFAVLSEIYRLMQKKNSPVVAIDGRCGSGKTYLAELIGKLFSCNICHMDDFYMPLEQRRRDWTEIPGGNMDLKRFHAEVLHPIGMGQQADYRPYDCKKNEMGETVKISPDRLTVVEGSYSHHPLLSSEYDLTIFLTCSSEEQRKRLQMREGGYFSVFEKQWIPMEENYFSHYSIEKGSSLVVDTSF